MCVACGLGKCQGCTGIPCVSVDDNVDAHVASAHVAAGAWEAVHSPMVSARKREVTFIEDEVDFLNRLNI